MIMYKILLLLLVAHLALESSEKYPADISYLIADLKYSEEHGVKICEVQQGILSCFYGDVYMRGGEGKFSPGVAEVFSSIPLPKWGVGMTKHFAPLRTSLLQSGSWQEAATFEELVANREFLEAARTAPDDPTDISSYKAIVYSSAPDTLDVEAFCAEFPGVLFADRPTYAYWKDKYLMTLLFTRRPELSRIKPEWGLYPKKYTPDLAAQIIQDIPADTYVIKPRSAFIGAGVIIVSKEDLDSTLKYIFSNKAALIKSRDHSYSYWAIESHNSFLIEKYYPSDTLMHEGKLYEPTMRVAFVLVRSNNKTDFHFLGGNWILTQKSLDQAGTLNEHKKAYAKVPNFRQVPEDVLEKVQKELEGTLPLLYEEML